MPGTSDPLNLENRPSQKDLDILNMAMRLSGKRDDNLSREDIKRAESQINYEREKRRQEWAEDFASKNGYYPPR